MSRIILSKTEAEYSLDTILNFCLEHYGQLRQLFDCDTHYWSVNVIQYLKDQDITVDFGEVMKAKMTEKLLKAVEADEDIPLGKLLMLQAMTTNPNFGINDLVQLKLMEKLLDEPEVKTKEKTK